MSDAENKKLFWQGPGILPLPKDKKLKAGEELPEGVLSKERIAYFVGVGKLSENEVTTPEGSQQKLLARVSEQETEMKSLGKDIKGLQKENTVLKKDNADQKKEIEDLKKSLSDLKEKAKSEGLLAKLGLK